VNDETNAQRTNQLSWGGLAAFLLTMAVFSLMSLFLLLHELSWTALAVSWIGGFVATIVLYSYARRPVVWSSVESHLLVLGALLFSVVALVIGMSSDLFLIANFGGTIAMLSGLCSGAVLKDFLNRR
jgi:hypothetical protein